MSVTDKPITRDDIKSKLHEIQGTATQKAEDAKSTAIAVAAVVGAVILVGVYVLGRRGGRRKSTVIELKRV